MLELRGLELYFGGIFLLRQGVPDLLHMAVPALEDGPLFVDAIAHVLDGVNFLVDVVEQPGDLLIALQRDESAIVAHAPVVVDEDVQLVPVLRLQVDGVDQLQDGSFQHAQLTRLQDVQQDLQGIDVVQLRLEGLDVLFVQLYAVAQQVVELPDVILHLLRQLIEGPADLIVLEHDHPLLLPYAKLELFGNIHLFPEGIDGLSQRPSFQVFQMKEEIEDEILVSLARLSVVAAEKPENPHVND
jgi:hypothetical protein